MRHIIILIGAFFFLSSLSFSLSAMAVNVAVIDSGTDLRHIDLKSKAWVNLDEVGFNKKDDDGNGKIDDLNGWNFAEDNNKIIDYSYLGSFSPDCYKFFEIQLKIMQGTATAEDKIWMAEKRGDQEFIAELQKFGNFVHGTHVAGLAAKDAMKAKIMAVKLIATEIKSPFSELFNTTMLTASFKEIDQGADFLIKLALDALAKQQGTMLEPIAQYVAFEKMRVANCSFGTSTHQLAPVFKQLISQLLGQEISDEEALAYAGFFIGRIVEYGKQFAVTAKNTFFVVAAGNDGSNNDELPTYPANVKRENTLSVAATYGFAKLAKFSNYGENTVDVAAPGVGIYSSIPGNEYLVVSGTSQASPFVANVAGRVLDTNPGLGFIELKRILMDTSDKKDFLYGKVRSGGIVNPMRALKAAQFSLTKSISTSITQAIIEVPDQVDSKASKLVSEQDATGLLVEMPRILK